MPGITQKFMINIYDYRTLIIMPKYTPTLKDFEQPGGCAKLERDGFSREQIHKSMYKLTDGATTEYRNKLMSNLYDRGKSK